MNDVVASLLAGNYVQPSTRCAVVLGTGLNAAISLPSHLLSAEKLSRLSSQNKDFVLLNTELSLLGDGIFPKTRWDEVLVGQLPRGTCRQPLEYLCSGYYLGEIVRLVLKEATEQEEQYSQRLGGVFDQPFCLPSSLLAAFEEDSSPNLTKASQAFNEQLGVVAKHQLSLHELRYIQTVAKSVSRRAAAYMAVCIHALCKYAWQSKRVQYNPARFATMVERRSIIVAGAVFEKYPMFKDNCEEFLRKMHEAASMLPVCYSLHKMPHSSTMGTAIAAAAVRSAARRSTQQ